MNFSSLLSNVFEIVNKSNHKVTSLINLDAVSGQAGVVGGSSVIVLEMLEKLTVTQSADSRRGQGRLRRLRLHLMTIRHLAFVARRYPAARRRQEVTHIHSIYIAALLCLFSVN